MGGGSWTATDWMDYTTTHTASAKTVDDIYKSKRMDANLDPKNAKLRESCDSGDNPNSTAIIVALDVTGSMDRILDSMARDGLGKLVQGIYDRKPVSDPHVMFMGVGDAYCDDAPLQVTQFEADIRIAEQMIKVWFEKGGGGNNSESYTLPWYYAAYHTKIDCFDKRNQKGFLFTIGDDGIIDRLTKEQILEVTGDVVEADISTSELLNTVSRRYEVFHLIPEDGGSYSVSGCLKPWRNVLGERAIAVSNYKNIPEVIVSTLQVMRGAPIDDVINSWDGSTSIVVKNAIGNMTIAEGRHGLVEF